jgi:CheY-like chemotaxis protein/glycine cleavage system H lipoate-binding protein
MTDRARILVVDDELPVCRSVSGALEGEYLVDSALSGEEAIRRAREQHYGVVITDLMMPGLSGMDLLKQVTENQPDAKVIMITGYPSIKSAVESIKLGAFDYIPKPFTPAELRSVVARALESRRYHKAAERAEADAAVTVPEDIYRIAENSWACIQKDGLVRIGADHVFIRTIRGMASLELPEVGQMRYQGEACVRIRDQGGLIHKIWAPVSGRVVAVNKDLADDIGKLERDPYGDGWLAVLSPIGLESDLKNLAPSKSD